MKMGLLRERTGLLPLSRKLSKRGKFYQLYLYNNIVLGLLKTNRQLLGQMLEGAIMG